MSMRHSDASLAELSAALHACSFGIVLHEVASGKAPELRTVQPLRCGAWRSCTHFRQARLRIQAWHTLSQLLRGAKLAVTVCRTSALKASRTWVDAVF